MEVVYANCFGAPAGELLITDEAAVADAAPPATRVVLADARYDPELAQAANEQLAEMAYRWTRLDGADPTLREGVSAADLAGSEALLTILLPAARGVLDARAALEPVAAVTVAVPSTSHARFDRVERVTAEGFASAAGGSVRWSRASDPRNDVLVAKYAHTRNPDFRPRDPAPAHLVEVLSAAGVNLLNRVRGRGPVRALVLSYHPTSAFARVYRANGGGPLGLVRLGFGRRELATMIGAGDRALATLRGPEAAPRDAGMQRALATYIETHREELGRRFTVAGIDLWPVVGERLVALALDYASWAQPRLRKVRRALEAGRVGVVLLPFDGPPEARLVLRAAQALGIPTAVINDGWKGDQHQQDGMAADRALAWSESIARNYYARRRHGRATLVTGNPRSDEARRRPSRRAPSPGEPLRRVLVGTLTFSPSDLNCRRSDPERFLQEVLEGIAASRRARGGHVLIKLHPADRLEGYKSVLGRFGGLDLETRSVGDVVDLFSTANVYVTTYSTSLLEAAARGLPVAYYRVNQQRLQPPFSDDPVMAARTASSPQDLAALLDDAGRLALPDGEIVASWLEEHLGPADGRCSERVAEALIADARLPESAPVAR